jgi:hypothetical protein
MVTLGESSLTPAQSQVRFLSVYACTLLLIACQAAPPNADPATSSAIELTDGAYQVFPGDDIQEALELAASDRVNKVVRVHAGTYRPRRHGQALIWFNRRHDGIVLEAVGDVTLTAANPEIADRTVPSFPAVVNHVVYFGDRVSSDTVLRGFRITGAKGYVTTSDEPEPIQPDLSNPRLQKKLFFYADGGGIKIFGRSYPTIENVEVVDNLAQPCGGGVSIEHRGYNTKAVTFRNSIFRNNRARVTGSGVDVLDGSAAVFENCLFVGNISNMGTDEIGLPFPFNREHGSGALTVFFNSWVDVKNSTFTGNWNGVDDKGKGSKYTNTIFWNNTAKGGILSPNRYEFDILNARGVKHCRIGGGMVADPRKTLDGQVNDLDAEDPQFDAAFRPTSPAYEGIGYRPVE